MKIRAVLVILFFSLSLSGLKAQDTQWRGLNRDGKYMDTGLLKKWPDNGPELILKKEDLGKGYSTPVFYEGEVYISGRRDSVDVITRLDLEGNISWETVYGKAWNKSFSETRSTPSIENGRLYIMGGMGTVVCMETRTGKILWEVNTHREYEGEFHHWGMAESLLLTDKAVISSPVGEQTAVVALDKQDGSLIWKTGSLGGKRSYASPLLIDYKGQEMILVTSSKDLMAVSPDNGSIIWSYDIVTGNSGPKNRRINTNTPLYKDGKIFSTSGYDANALMFQLSAEGEEVNLIWRDSTLDTHHGGVVLVDGYIYGSNWINNGNGNWVCQEWETGEVMYEEKWFNKGSVIYADGLLYLYEEKQGNVGLLIPSPEGFKLVNSFKINGGSGPHWAHMSIYDRKLFVRHGEVLFVYNIAEQD